jgi:hypothetical protein
MNPLNPDSWGIGSRATDKLAKNKKDAISAAMMKDLDVIMVSILCRMIVNCFRQLGIYVTIDHYIDLSLSFISA